MIAEASRSYCAVDAQDWRPTGHSPYVYRKTICIDERSRFPVIGLRVVGGRGNPRASYSPTSRFNNVDLPAFGRPISATKPARGVRGAGPSRLTRAALSRARPAPARRAPHAHARA